MAHNLSKHYEAICNLIIRPPRVIYEVAELGPVLFSCGGQQCERFDFAVRRNREKGESGHGTVGSGNRERLAIQCSYYGPAKPSGPRNVVIYCHGNGGCRLEAQETVQLFLPIGISVVAVDFCGSGLSDGDYVTLGWFERIDLKAVVDFLRSDTSPFMIDKVALWGRSMGAVTSLFFTHLYPSAVVAQVLDSPYSDLPKLCRELVGQVVTFKVPSFAVSGALKMIRSSIKSRAGVDIEQLAPIEFVDKCFVPAMFLHGSQDTFVGPQHSRALHERYGGDKSLHLIDDGDHNSQRPFETQLLGLEFICQAFGIALATAATTAAYRAAYRAAGSDSASTSSTSSSSSSSSAKTAEEQMAARAHEVIGVVQRNIAAMLGANGVTPSSLDDAAADHDQAFDPSAFIATNDVSLVGGQSIRDLKITLAYLKVDYSDCVEKVDLVSRLLTTLIARKMWRETAPLPYATTPSSTSSTTTTTATTNQQANAKQHKDSDASKENNDTSTNKSKHRRRKLRKPTTATTTTSDANTDAASSSTSNKTHDDELLDASSESLSN